MNISLVAGTRARPQSLDAPALVQTPVHPVTFASQQDAEISARGSPKLDAAMMLPPYEVQNAAAALRRENPSQERAGSKDKDSQFDFQRFLDQMKTKSAEPVARYLRSCVLAFIYAVSALTTPALRSTC
jgi:hypothetical protein